ncbi:hypothetical protein LguiB_021496 [Lonicera macranthoides]
MIMYIYESESESVAIFEGEYGSFKHIINDGDTSIFQYKSSLSRICCSLAPIRSSIDFGKKSYVAAVRNSITVPPLMEIDGSKIARPSKNVNEVLITLLKEVNLQSLQECRSNLLGKVYFSKRVVSANEDYWKPLLLMETTQSIVIML